MNDYPICARCGSSAPAPPSWRCRGCRAHAALYGEVELSDEDRRVLRLVAWYERLWRRQAREQGHDPADADPQP